MTEIRQGTSQELRPDARRDASQDMRQMTALGR